MLQSDLLQYNFFSSKSHIIQQIESSGNHKTPSDYRLNKIYTWLHKQILVSIKNCVCVWPLVWDVVWGREGDGGVPKRQCSNVTRNDDPSSARQSAVSHNIAPLIFTLHHRHSILGFFIIPLLYPDIGFLSIEARTVGEYGNLIINIDSKKEKLKENLEI